MVNVREFNATGRFDGKPGSQGKASSLVSQKPLEPESKLCEMAEEFSAVEVHDRHAICNII
jgi:hypothetical protein